MNALGGTRRIPQLEGALIRPLEQWRAYSYWIAARAARDVALAALLRELVGRTGRDIGADLLTAVEMASTVRRHANEQGWDRETTAAVATEAGRAYHRLRRRIT